MNEIIRRSIESQVTSQLFFSQEVDITVFVEDKDESGRNQKFYQILLSRVFEHKAIRVNNMGGRSQVVKAHGDHCNNPCGSALFIIDGDYHILHSPNKKYAKGLYQLKKYCIENYLIDENAIVEVIYYSHSMLTLDDVRNKLGFQEWVDSNDRIACDLYTIYAICDILRLKRVKTSKRTIQEYNPSDDGILDASKVQSLIASINSALNKNYCNHKIQAIRKEVESSMKLNNYRMLDICSGKSLLIPLLFKRIHTKIGHIIEDINVFYIQLAERCNIDDLLEIQNHTIE